ncbi:ribonuclease HI, partial [Limosilactobacillus mucosae]|nr:ribonuclease HI [Limosilactobacillus mucosae]
TQTSLDLFGEEQGPRFIPKIVFYTDGGSRNHGNRRGDHVHQDDRAAWAYLIRFEDGLKITDTAGELGATNNRMEVMGLLKCLQRLLELNLQNEPIEGILDSEYVLNPIKKGRLYGWARRGWKTTGGKPVANQELWAEVSVLLPKFKQLRFKWTKGHANSHGNVTVDRLLNKTMNDFKD